MSERLDIADIAERRHALDPSRSFIVQAPAGSGKTELLIQRYLVLLARVESPEEIAAITFTKKAAAEMRKRVLEALAQARAHRDRDAAAGSSEVALQELPPHQRLTLEHACAALDRDRALGWRLEENAARLRIQTIDALCASLTRQMPVLAAFGAQPQSVEDAEPRYREAARATLALLEEAGESNRSAADAVATLLAHLDNNVAVAEDLIAGMLGKRDHWLRNLMREAHGVHDREGLEAALGAVRRDAVATARSLLPEQAAAALGAPAAEAVEAWQAIAEQLLTKKGEWRKRSALAQSLAEHDELREALFALTRLPHARYSDAQWEALGAIARLLPLAVAELKVVFASRGEADFVEIAQGALVALGDPEAPTDLLLSLDYRIHHILVDEFQDTSFTQFELLEKLTAGWGMGGEADDGRTLFLVGDPMQSIYRFREAEVGLFLKARNEGIGQVALDPLTLSVNFRSQADIVDWVNRAFAQVMPQTENIAAGAVPYSPSEPVHPAESDAVCVHAFFDGDAQAEAEQVAMLIGAAQTQDPDGSIAVLVRNRSHLEDIVPRLKQRGLRFRAIEIESLGHRQVVQDLLALTRALAHPADRLAWLAVLRAPWCGLTLADLHALVSADIGSAVPLSPGPSPARGEGDFCVEREGGITTEIPLPPGGGGARGEGVISNILEDSFYEGQSPSGSTAYTIVRTDNRTLWELLHDEARLARLSADGRARIVGDGAERLGVRGILAHAMASRLRGALRDRVESTWLALGGPACAATGTDLEDAEIYLDYLEQSEQAGEIADIAAFEEGLAKLYALPDLEAEDTDVQIMTVHKSKGLEFDTVILPGLGKVPRRREPSLFLWMERTASSHPSPSTGEGPAVFPPSPSTGERAAAILPSPSTGERAAAILPSPLTGERAAAILPSPLTGEGPGERVVDSSFPRKRESSLLLAPIKETGAEADTIYDYLVRLDGEKASHEDGRLLYVAATRAKRHLHLLGDTALAPDSGDAEADAASPVKSPSARSLLAKLWPAVEADFEASARTAPPGGGSVGGERATPADQDLRRLPSDWSFPAAPPPARWSAPKDSERTRDEIEFSWVGETARHVGSVVHRWLQRIAEDAMQGWSRARIETLREAFRDQLTACGVEEKELDAAAERVAMALANSLDDPRGQWLLGPQREARSEYRLAAIIEGERRNLVIDRTFVDAEGRRWIVDYKTSGHAGAGLDAFLDRERLRYAAQLERYARALGGAEQTRLGLYFPLVSGWRE